MSNLSGEAEVHETQVFPESTARPCPRRPATAPQLNDYERGIARSIFRTVSLVQMRAFWHFCMSRCTLLTEESYGVLKIENEEFDEVSAALAASIAYFSRHEDLFDFIMFCRDGDLPPRKRLQNSD